MAVTMENEDLRLKLHTLAGKAGQLDGKNSIPLAELLTTDFIQTYTVFSSLEELLRAGHYEVDSPEDIETIADERFNAYIKATTKFNSWPEMLKGASERWIRTRLL